MNPYIKRLIYSFSAVSLLGLTLYCACLGFSLKPPAVGEPAISRPAKKSRAVSMSAQQPYRPLATAIVTQPLVQAFMSQDPDRIQLVNFFSYGCYGCMRWYSFLEKWAKQHAKQVVIYHFPISFQKQLEPLARAYFIAKILKRSDLDARLFAAIHEENKLLIDQKQLADFFAQYGVSHKTFNNLYHSFTVNQYLTQAKNMAIAYQITVSPSLVLNMPHGRYLITPNFFLEDQGERTLFGVLDRLLARTEGR